MESALTYAHTYAGILGLAGASLGIIAYGFAYGAGNIRAFALAIPIAAFLFLQTPDAISDAVANVTSYASIVLFAIFLFGTFMLMRRMQFSGGLLYESGGVLLSTLALLLLFGVAIYQLAPFPLLTNLFPTTFATVFAEATHAFWVTALALVLLFVA